MEIWLGSMPQMGPGLQQFQNLVSSARELPLCQCLHERGWGICRAGAWALVCGCMGWVIWAQRDSSCTALLPWQARRLEATSSLLNSNKDGGILCLFYLKSKQFLLCLMSKRFRKQCRENMLHLSDFQPVFLAAAAAEQISARAAAPHMLPSCLELAEGLGAAPGQARRETVGERKLSSGWSHSA